MADTAHGLWYPDVNTKLSPLHTLLANMQNTNELAFAAVDTAAQTNVTNAGERNFATGAARDAWYVAHPETPLATGLRCRVAGLTYRYVSGTWRVDQQLIEAHLNLVSEASFGVVQYNFGVPLTSVYTMVRFHPFTAPDSLNKVLLLDETASLSSGIVNWFVRNAATGAALPSSRVIFHAIGLIAT